MRHFTHPSYMFVFKMLLALLITIVTLYLIIQIADNGTPRFDNNEIHSSNAKQSENQYTVRLIEHNNSESEYSPLTMEIQPPPSLMGTDLPASFEMDSDGNLVINRGTRSIFDYFLTSQGELSKKNIWAQIDKIINQQLDQKAQDQARRLFKNYLSYQDALHNLARAFPLNTGEYGEMDISNPETLIQLEARFHAKQSLREEYFGISNKEAFFDEEEQYDRYHLDKLSINSNNFLSKEERQYQLSQLHMQLPEKQLDNRNQVHAIQTLKEQLGELAQKGASYQERMMLVTEMAGEEAADRFAVSQLRTDEWESKRKSFLQQRKEININPALGKEEKEAAINYLLTSMEFTDGDILRLNALDRIDG